jgi:SAM-dependent methyltransferase
MLVRCLRCRATPVTLSLIAALKQELGDLGKQDAYELSGRGPLVRYLQPRVKSLALSEFFEDLPPGHWRGRVQCQDVQELTFASGQFDLCTSTEVFEHVPDDLRGFREIHRVLRDDGHFVFTVPMSPGATVERARMNGGKVEHLLAPEYHSDRLRGKGRVLCFRNYGADIVERLLAAGFKAAFVRSRPEWSWFGYSRPVIVARK